MEKDRDQQLWHLAKCRASFRRHLGAYIVIGGFLWAIWWFTLGPREGVVPWPVWSTLGWGIVLAFQYMYTYVYPKGDAVMHEYEKLVREKENLNQ